MLPWSVMPSAGCPSAAASATSSSTREAPSSIENSVWVWRWTKRLRSAIPCLVLLRWVVHRQSTPTIHMLWTSYTGVI